ncbi:MAG: hypothetical protein K0Q57_253 [Gammaproteobacteria bacterium]|jgi:hypothetical protein|nr:hypothetical protein [Gammaproteobacteria bacterium]
MLGELKVEHSPMEEAKYIILAAFNNTSKNRRQAQRIVQRVLNLAATRGYPYSEEFNHYFRHMDEQSDMLTKKWLSGLFEYVSPDECAQLSKLNSL